MAAAEVVGAMKGGYQVENLYELCVTGLSVQHDEKNLDIRALPTNILFDLCHGLYKVRNLCSLNFSICHLDVFDRLLRLTHVRPKLHTIFQALEEHDTKIGQKLTNKFGAAIASEMNRPQPNIETAMALIRSGLRLGTFFGDAAWYEKAHTVLSSCRDLCESFLTSIRVKKTLLRINQHLLKVQASFSDIQGSGETYQRLMDLINQLKAVNECPNLAAIYTNLSLYYFVCNDFKLSFEYVMTALKELHDDLPPKVKLDALRQASKSCVVRRMFEPARVLIEQALNLATTAFGTDHPKYGDTQADYGYFLINYDCIQESVSAYELAYQLRRRIFLKRNLLVAIGLEDLSYALYVLEYSSGRFDRARALAEEAVEIMTELLPSNHIMLSSPQRVKALILEEISIDTATDDDMAMLKEAEQLHMYALKLAREHFGEMNVQTAKHYGNLGRLYQSMKKFGDAESMQIKAIKIKEAILGPNDYEVGLSLGHLASLYNYHMKKYHESLPLYHRSIEISVNLFGPDYSGLEYDYRGLVNVHTKFGDRSKALEYQEMLINWRLQRERMRNQPKAKVLCQPPRPICEVVSRVMESLAATKLAEPTATASTSSISS